jgi:hypothetical protein
LKCKKLTPGSSIHAERAVYQLDLGSAILDVPLLLGLVVQGLAAAANPKIRS